MQRSRTQDHKVITSQQKSDHIKSFLNNYSNLSIQSLKSNFDSNDYVFDHTDTFLIYMLTHMFEKNVFKCELLEFALAYRYKSFEKLKQSIVVELGDEKYGEPKINKIQDFDTSIMSKTIWIIE